MAFNPRLTSFGQRAVSQILDEFDGYPVYQDDLLAVEAWYADTQKDECSWDEAGDWLKYFVPHLWRLVGEESAGWLSLLGWTQHHIGFPKAVDDPLKFYRAVDDFIKSLGGAGWKDGFFIVRNFEPEATRDGITEHEIKWYKEAVVVVQAYGAEALPDYRELILRGIAGQILTSALPAGMDSELIHSLLDGEEADSVNVV